MIWFTNETQVNAGGQMISAVLFLVIAGCACVCALLAILGTGQLALSSADAIERDGLARGQRAPAWALPDSAGLMHRSPPAAALQLILFADHSLRSFPSVVAGLRALRDRAAAADLEMLIMLRGPSEIAGPELARLGLAGIPVLTGSPARYADHNIRVMPFAIFVDSRGLIRASSLVNHDWQVRKLWQIAGLPLEPGQDGARKAGGRPGARRAGGRPGARRAVGRPGVRRAGGRPGVRGLRGLRGGYQAAV